MSIEEILPFAIQLRVTFLHKNDSIHPFHCQTARVLICQLLAAPLAKGKLPQRWGNGGREQDLPQIPLLTELGEFILWPRGLCSTAQPKGHSECAAQQYWQSTDWNCIGSFTFRAVWDTDPRPSLPYFLLCRSQMPSLISLRKFFRKLLKLPKGLKKQQQLVTPKATPGPALAAKHARFIDISEPMQKTQLKSSAQGEANLLRCGAGGRFFFKVILSQGFQSF